MSIHRPARTFADSSADGVVTIGHACAQVMARLQWNRMKWERGHSATLPREDGERAVYGRATEEAPREDAKTSSYSSECQTYEDEAKVNTRSVVHADHLRRVRRLKAIEASWDAK